MPGHGSSQRTSRGAYETYISQRVPGKGQVQVQVQVQGTIRGDLTSGLRFVDQALGLAVQASNLSLQERGLVQAPPGCCNTALRTISS
jgi:hypothetical protein